MKRRRKKSKKRYAASSSAKRLDSAVFYLDESIYSGILAEALGTAGMQVRRAGTGDVPFGTPDDQWLAIAGSNQWIVLMRDQRVRHRTLEIQALKGAGVGAFVVTTGQATAYETACIVTGKLAKILNISRSERRPFLYTLGARGALSRVKIR
jgi:PIN like domain